MFRGFLAGAVFAIMLLVFFLVRHLGIFRTVTFDEEVRGPYYVTFQEHTGSYYQISEVISKIEAQIKAKNLDCAKTFGEYLDDPSQVDEDRLRSYGGCISENPYPAIPGLQSAEFAKQKYVVARFSGSPAIGPWKVYSGAKRYLDQRRLVSRGETIEIYTLNAGSISTEYLFPLK